MFKSLSGKALNSYNAATSFVNTSGLVQSERDAFWTQHLSDDQVRCRTRARLFIFLPSCLVASCSATVPTFWPSDSTAAHRAVRGKRCVLNTLAEVAVLHADDLMQLSPTLSALEHGTGQCTMSFYDIASHEIFCLVVMEVSISSSVALQV